MHISSNAKRALFVVILGGAIGASCALPGYETDSGLSGSSSSSSSSTSGTGQGGAGGASGTGGQGGAMPDAVPMPVVCPEFYAATPKVGESCTDAIDKTLGVMECGFAQDVSNMGCCVTVMTCMKTAAGEVWEEAPVQPPCMPRDPQCPAELGCMPPMVGKACPGTPSVDALKQGANCSCFTHPSTGGEPGQQLPVCLIGKEGVCANTPKGAYPMLACVPDAANPMHGKWVAKEAGCCFPNQNQEMVCKIDGLTACKEFTVAGTGAAVDSVCYPLPPP